MQQLWCSVWYEAQLITKWEGKATFSQSHTSDFLTDLNTHAILQGLEIPATELAGTDSDNRDRGSEQTFRIWRWNFVGSMGKPQKSVRS